ncbi:MAG: methyl-accepting chemotaxis protein [Proteobacteria bacterium]|nr:methyl-accepting chemotaxis protein [Pseudomonadota bacterium]
MLKPKKIPGEGNCQDTGDVHMKEPPIAFLPDQMVDFCSSLTGTLQNVEPQFIEMGACLQGINQTIHALMDQVISASRQMKEGAVQDDGFADVVNVVTNSLKELTGCQQEIDDNLNSVHIIKGHLEKMDRSREQIEIIAKRFRAVGLNMVIESARSREMEDKFGIIATEVKQLSVSINQFIKDMEVCSEDSMNSLMLVFNTISDSRDHIKSLIENAECEAQKTIHESEQLVKFSLNLMDQADKQSQDISSQIGEVVMGLQFSDRMKQTGEAVISRLLDIFKKDGSGEMPEDLSDDPAHETYQPVYATIHSQLIVLKHIKRNFDAVYEKNDRAFSVIGNAVRELNESISKLSTAGTNYDPSGSTPKNENPVVALINVLTNLKALLMEIDGLMLQLREGTSIAAKKTGKLLLQVEKIEEISSETSRKALNAIISAGKLGGNGSALNALANEMKDLANHSRGFVASMEEVLSEASLAMKDLEDRMEKEVKNTSSDQGQRRIMEDLIVNVDTRHNYFEKAAVISDQFAHELNEKMSHATTKLDFFPPLSRKLNCHIDRLESFLGILRPNVSDRFIAALPDVVMDEKLGMFTEAENSSTNENGLPENRKNEESQGEDLFDDNIELF